jgi:hypothetical protein
MWKSHVLCSLVAAGLWVSEGSMAVAQVRNPYLAASNRDLQNQVVYSSPTVSPYVNLGFNANGVSNYQSLVKPMIDDREAIRLNAGTLQQLRQQMRDSREPKGGSPGTRAPVNSRFMHYSHFYGGAR